MVTVAMVVEEELSNAQREIRSLSTLFEVYIEEGAEVLHSLLRDLSEIHEIGARTRRAARPT